ncbi:MAG: DNA polymerase III subunit delta [Candidatus Falkowbacteria bacterium]
MIILLFGKDTFRSRRKLSEFKQKYIREVDPSGDSLDRYDAKELTVEKFKQAMMSSSLFARKRMIIFERIVSAGELTMVTAIGEYLKEQADHQGDNIIIFWDEVFSGDKHLAKERTKLLDWLTKQQVVQEYKPYNNMEVATWIRQDIERRGGTITHEAVNRLVSLIGSDLWQLDQELNKLWHHQAGQQLALGDGNEGVKIGIEQIKELVTGSFSEQIFQLTDAISNRQRGLAMQLLQDQLDGGMSEEYMLFMIERQFKILVQVRQALDNGWNVKKIASQLKLHPFVAQKSATQVHRFQLDGLKKILNRLVEVDFQSKTGQGKPKLALTRLIAGL